MKIRNYRDGDHDKVIALWKACALIVPQNDPSKDIDRKMAHSPDLFFIGDEDGEIVATVMAGYEGHRGAVNYLAVKPDMQGIGLGQQLMAYVEDALRKLGCAKINLNVRTSNRKVIQFYERIGFKQDEIVCLGKRLIVDEHSY